ncbi:hypothetical protein [Micromonospora sp. NPDC005189]|uniref:hypothetical protein n=1 Tax=unclassified Micromonospora TaxID=2617518 RepID=UPI0033A1B4BB
MNRTRSTPPTRLPELTAGGSPDEPPARRRRAPCTGCSARGATLAAQAWSTVDGQGRARVVDAVFDAVRPADVRD